MAIHGLLGHLIHEEDKFSWLKDLLPAKFPSADIYTFTPQYGSDSNTERLMWALSDQRALKMREYVPIILIGLNLGGTVAKEFFIETSASQTSQRSLNRLHSSISAFVFLGTYHNSDEKTPLTLETYRTYSPLFRFIELEKNPEIFGRMAGINREFRLLKGESLPTVNFFETKSTREIGGIVC